MKNNKKSVFFILFFLVMQYNISAQSDFVPDDNIAMAKGSAYNTAANVAYLTPREKKMVAEVNLLRGNPKQYILYVEENIRLLQLGKKTEGGYTINTTKTQRKGGAWTVKRDTIYDKTTYDKTSIDTKKIAAARELIAELKKIKSLSLLQPQECLCKAAKQQGIVCKQRGKLGHEGAGGAMPWDRLPKACPKLPNGAENLGAGAQSMRQAMLNLLIDERVPNRGHRKNLLNPATKYIGVYDILGGITDMPNNAWVQNFGWQ